MFLSKFVNSRSNKAKYPDFKTRRKSGIAAWNRKKGSSSSSSSSSSSPLLSLTKFVNFVFGSSEPACYKDMCKEGIRTKTDYVKFLRSHHPDKIGRELTRRELTLFDSINDCYKKGKYCTK
jgi:hypothetical protein